MRVTARTGGLEGTGLIYEDVVADGIVLVVQGHEGTGKSSLALDGPGPIAYFHTNDGVDRALPRFRQINPKKKVAFASYTWQKPEFSQAMKKSLKGDAWDRHWTAEAERIKEEAYDPFINDWHKAVDSGEFRTMVQDFATLFWEMFPLAAFGKLQENPQLNWGPVNRAYMDCILRAKNAGINVVLVHQVAPVYKNVPNPRTGKMMSQLVEGKFKRKGMKQVGYVMDSAVETLYDEPQYFNGKQRSEEAFSIRIVHCKDDTTLNGKTFDAMGFAELCMMLKPNVDPARWE